MKVSTMSSPPIYYECHVTIEPVFDERRDLAEAIAEKYGFRLAKLLMQRNRNETPERSDKDTFMTATAKPTPEGLELLSMQMGVMMVELEQQGFQVWRYKIEAALIDVRLPKKGENATKHD